MTTRINQQRKKRALAAKNRLRDMDKCAVRLDRLIEARAAAEGKLPKLTFEARVVRCGLPNCSRCPHGTYWYVYYREGKRTRSVYIGKYLPRKARAMTKKR